MTIINNRRKICSEVPSDKYKDNYDAIFGKKDKVSSEKQPILSDKKDAKEDKDGHT